MTTDKFILDGIPESAFGEQNFSFWIKCVVDGMDLIGPETDSHLEDMIGALLDYYGSADVSPEVVERIPSEIVRLRGTGFWRDDSRLGLKYRCISNLACSREKNLEDLYYWQYGVESSFDLIDLHDDKAQALVALIRGNASKLGVDLSNKEDRLERDLRNVMVLLEQAEMTLRLADTILNHAEEE